MAEERINTLILSFSQVFEPWGRGGYFILVLLSLSAITDNSTWCHYVFQVCFTSERRSPEYMYEPRSSRFIHISTIFRYPDSAGLSMQTLSPRFHKIPRVFFTVLAFLIFTVASVAGRQHFSVILSNFLAVVCIRVVAPTSALDYPPWDRLHTGSQYG